MVDERVPAEHECCEAVASSVLRVMLQMCVLIHAYLMFSFMSVGGVFLGNVLPHG